MKNPETIAMPRLPKRNREAHKGDFGRVYILAGRVGFTGAPVLAAAGGLKTGAGLVHVGVGERAYPIVANKLLCAMPEPLLEGKTPAEPGGDPGWTGGQSGPEAGADPDQTGGEPGYSGGLSGKNRDFLLHRMKNMDAALLGPGLGRHPETEKLILDLTEELMIPLILDADGINALSTHMDVLDRRKDRLTILTPHMGEFARLLGRPVGEDRAKEATEFATGHHCVLVLKGKDTLVAMPDGDLYQNPTGNPGMAVGGSGDVLSGMILGLLGQGFGAKNACCWGVYLHGLAGDLAAEERGEYAMTAGDLLEFLPKAMKRAEGS